MPYKKNVKEAAYGRDVDGRQDVKWAHPEVAKWWVAGNADMIDDLCDDGVPLAKRKKRLATLREGAADMYAKKPYDPFNGIDWKDKDPEPYAKLQEFDAHGCPEEPETHTKVYVTIPTHKSEKPLPVIFYVMGGAFFTHDIRIFPEVMRWAKQFNCAVVAPDYRTPLDAKYPGEINDMHAGYQWMVDHAAELNIDPDNVTIFGESTGAHLALCMAFRLKRYGFKPRGCVVNDPMVDDRNYFESCKLIKDPCDATRAHAMFATYVGWENCGTNLLGPEAFANHATVDECRGLCPIFLNVGESDQDRDATIEFAKKCYIAKVPCSLHVWEGCAHATLYYSRKTGLALRFWNNLYGDLQNCMQYDMRRTPDQFGEEVRNRVTTKTPAGGPIPPVAVEIPADEPGSGEATRTQEAANSAAAKDPVFDAVVSAVAQSYDRDAAALSADTDISKFDNNSSSKVLKVAMFLGEELELEEDLEFEDLAELCTVGEIVDMLKKRLGK